MEGQETIEELKLKVAELSGDVLNMNMEVRLLRTSVAVWRHERAEAFAEIRRLKAQLESEQEVHRAALKRAREELSQGLEKFVENDGFRQGAGKRAREVFID
jgi:hypothetical protein